MKKIITLSFLFLLFSCGTRKVQKSEINEILKKDSISKIKETSFIDDNDVVKKDIIEDSFIVEPIDSTKAITIIDQSGKISSYKNARLRHEIKKDKSTILKTKKITQIKDSEVKSSIKAQIEQTKKVVQKENSFNWLWLFWLLIPAGVLWSYWKYKDKCHFV